MAKYSHSQLSFLEEFVPHTSDREQTHLLSLFFSHHLIHSILYRLRELYEML